MKDTVIKGNGKSRIMKAPSNMPSTYEEFRSKALEGKAYFDINVNADLTGSDAGIDVLGMPLNKANLLADDTATGLGLSAESATPDSAFKKVTERLNSADLILAKSKRYATKVIGTSTSGHTKNDVDYLCTGSADQSIINSAISALPSGGGNIILLEGTYNLTGTITMNKANVNLEGVGNKHSLFESGLVAVLLELLQYLAITV